MSDGEPAAEKRADMAKTKWPLWKKLVIIGAIFVVVVGLAVGLGVGLTRHKNDSDNDGSSSDGGNNGDGGNGGNGGNTTSSRSSTWRPKAGVSWQIVLKNPIILANDKTLTPDVDVYDLDMWENNATTFQKLHDANKKVICYFSAGSYEDWRQDKGDFKDSDLGHPLNGWPGERWLNLSSPNVHNIMARRIKQAADKGCDAIDPDNVDGYSNKENGLGLKAEDSITFMKFLHEESAKYNMSIGLKNAGEIIPDVLSFIDFSVNEQCVEHSECETFAAFIDAGKPVFNIEYPDGAPKVEQSKVKDICSAEGDSKGSKGFSQVIKKMELDGWVEYCDGKTYETKIGQSTS